MLLFIAGLVIAALSMLAAWAIYRKPGVPSKPFVPIWRARNYLTSTGMAVSVLGCLLGLLLAGASIVLRL